MTPKRLLLAGLILALAAVAIVLLLSQGDAKPDPAETRATEKPSETVAAPARAESTTAAASSQDGARLAAKATKDSMPEEYAKALSGLVGRVVEPEGTPAAGVPVELLGGLLEFFALDIDQLLFNPESFDLQISQQKVT